MSGHLGILSASGLVRSKRNARIVLYSRTDMAEQLLRAQPGSAKSDGSVGSIARIGGDAS